MFPNDKKRSTNKTHNWANTEGEVGNLTPFFKPGVFFRIWHWFDQNRNIPFAKLKVSPDIQLIKVLLNQNGNSIFCFLLYLRRKISNFKFQFWFSFNQLLFNPRLLLKK